MRVSVLLVVSTAFCHDGFDLRDAVLDCLFVRYADTLALDLVLGHALPHELCKDIAGKDRGSFAVVRKRLQLGSLRSG